MSNNPSSSDIDLVYLWVDGNDPAWQAKLKAFTGKELDNSPANCKGRYVDNDELKFSLRSVQMYAPWIRKVYIVTDGQTPRWLDTQSPKVSIVDHSEIMPPETLPCFNSSLIEKFLYKIPGLADRFLYANDDMLINRPVTERDFFTADGFPIVRLSRKPFRRLRWLWREKVMRKPLKNYSITLGVASQTVCRKYGVYFTGMPHHNIDSYLRDDCRRMAEEVMKSEFMENHSHHTRNDSDIQRIVFSYAALAERRGKLRYVDQSESMLVQIHKSRHYERLDRVGPLLFCMNDSEYCTDHDRARMREYLERRFPEKSAFEL